MTPMTEQPTSNFFGSSFLHAVDNQKLFGVSLNSEDPVFLIIRNIHIVNCMNFCYFASIIVDGII